MKIMLREGPLDGAVFDLPVAPAWMTFCLWSNEPSASESFGEALAKPLMARRAVYEASGFDDELCTEIDYYFRPELDEGPRPFEELWPPPKPH